MSTRDDADAWAMGFRGDADVRQVWIDRAIRAEAELARALRVVEAAKDYAKHFDRPLYLTNAVEEWEAGR